MPNDADEILVGGSGTVYVAPVGTTAPVDSDTALNANFLDLGYLTEDGVTITDSKDVNDILAWQSFYPVRRIVVGRAFQASFQLEQWNSRTVTLALGAGDMNGMIQVITLSGFDGTDSFKLTWNGVEGATTFTRGTNATAAAIQTALRTATGDTALTVAGTTDAGPFTITFVAPQLAYEVTVTSGTGGTTGVTTYTEAVYVPPAAGDLDERAMVIDWIDGTRNYRLYMPRGIVTESVESNITRTDRAVLPITFSAIADGATAAYLLFTDDPAFA